MISEIMMISGASVGGSGGNETMMLIAVLVFFSRNFSPGKGIFLQLMFKDHSIRQVAQIVTCELDVFCELN